MRTLRKRLRAAVVRILCPARAADVRHPFRPLGRALGSWLQSLSDCLPRRHYACKAHGARHRGESFRIAFRVPSDLASDRRTTFGVLVAALRDGEVGAATEGASVWLPRLVPWSDRLAAAAAGSLCP